MKKAILFDRDGTLIRDQGYIKKVDQVSFYNLDDDLLRKLNRDYLFFIVSNQSGISKGLVSQQDVDRIHRHIIRYFSKRNIVFSKVYCCSHQDADECCCKKPKTRFIEEIKRDYKINVSKSYMIGDHPSDILFSSNGGLNGIYLLTGHGKKHLREMRRINNVQYVIKKNIHQALKYIDQKGEIL